MELLLVLVGVVEDVVLGLVVVVVVGRDVFCYC